MAKYYYSEMDDLMCYSLQSHYDYMREHGLKQLEVFEAKREVGTGYFFCKETCEVGEECNCGKSCKTYIPRNGIKGICKHYGYCYEQTDKKRVLKLK